MTSKLFMRRAIIAAVAAITLAGSRPAFAQAPPPTSDQCMTQLSNCYYWAAMQSGFWTIWGSGIDCELAAANCIRLAIMGH